MYTFELNFLNTYNSVFSFSPDGRNIRENNLRLQEQAAKIYIDNRKITLQKYNDNFSTELVSDGVLNYCFASLKNRKILFNLIPQSSSPSLKEVSKLSLEQLEFAHNIKEDTILGKHKMLLKTGFPFEFRIINTCDAFLDFVKLNRLYPSKAANQILFSAFIKAFQNTNTEDFSKGCVCSLQSKEAPHKFKYIQFYDLILIIEYKRDILKEQKK
jgi:hypothetical protein